MPPSGRRRTDRALPVAPGERDEVPAGLPSGIKECARRREAELETVASVEIMLGIAFTETQPTLEYPDLLVNEGGGVGWVGDVGAGGKFDLDEFERPTGGRGYRTAAVTTAGIGPYRLIRSPHQPLAATLGAGNQFGKGHAQRSGQLAQERGGWLGLAALNFSNHRPGDTGALGKGIDRQLAGEPG